MKIVPPACSLGAIVLMVALHWVAPGARVLGFPWNLAGLAPIGVGLALDIVAALAFKRQGTTVKPFRESSALVTDGVFGLSRNPMYLGLVLILAGIALLLGSVTPWLVVPGFVVVMDRLFIRHEERMLAEKFGAAFEEYKQRVRRWV